MIARLIEVCIGNRGLVLMLGALLVAAGMVGMSRVTVDAIPDLSDVQVVIRTEYPGQAPQLVEDQVTYPLTTSMLAVPYAEVVRGYSMFGSSFVYVLFEDGTDLYWARSRVLEQLSTLTDRLPQGVTPQLGPDATGVGWVFQYMLTTGRYCTEHPDGVWHDPVADVWHASRDEFAEAEAVQTRLRHRRVFGDERTVYADMQGKRYERKTDAPESVRDELGAITVEGGRELCPVDGTPLVDSQVDLADLRSLQDWYLRYELTSVEGVSEIAPIGGYVKQYQVTVDPTSLLAYDLSLQQVRDAITRSNTDVGGRVIEMSETEYMLRGLGYLGTLNPEQLAEAGDEPGRVETLRTRQALDDLRHIALGATEDGSPIYLSNVASVSLGPEIRRGIAEWNGRGEAVGGIVVMRFGENAQRTIERVRSKLESLTAGLPAGVGIEFAYDRSDLIERAIDTVRETLVEEIVVVSLVMLVFLLHGRSAVVAALVLPAGVLATLLTMWAAGINANIMSLGGIAISIGVMVDSSVVMVENAHKHLEREKQRRAAGRSHRSRIAVVSQAAKEVGPTLFFSLLIITVSFLPIFVLGEQAGRFFKPLAFTKTIAMAAAALLAVTLIPVLMTYLITERTVPQRWPRWLAWSWYGCVVAVPAALLWLLPLPLPWHRGWWMAGWIVLASLVILPQRIVSEQANPVSRLLQWLYEPLFCFVMRFRWLSVAAAALVMAATLYPWSQLGSEFMPPLEEGDLLYMPTTDPGLSITKARELLQQTDKLIATFPEVQHVAGKIGRADTATDPAPLSMIETTITLHRDKRQWRQVPVDRFYDDWPRVLSWLPRQIWPQTRPITIDELVHGYQWSDGTHIAGMNEIVQFPGLTNAWTMPIKTRIDMLSTGIKTPVGIKVMGEDLQTLSSVTEAIAQSLKTAPGTGPFTISAFPEKTTGGHYLDVRIDRQAIARHGLVVEDVQEVIMTAQGGMNVDETVEGLRRYPINVRYPRELRDNLPALRATLVATPSGAQVPLGQLAAIEIHAGPPMIKSENARRTSWVYVDIEGIDVGRYVSRAQQVVADSVALPPGYSIVWSGQYEYMQQARERLLIAIPLAAGAIVLLLYAATLSWLRVSILVLSLPLSLVGAVWIVYLLNYNLSLAVWVGMIALAGLAAETGLVMLLYLDNSFDRFEAEGRMRNPRDLWHAIHEGAVQRIRPKTMTFMTTFIGLTPLLWAEGAGADTMRRLAAPMIGGLATTFVLVLLLYPAIFYIVKRVSLRQVFALNAADTSDELPAGRG